MVTHTIKVATPRDIRKFGNPGITVDIALAMLKEGGFDLGDFVNHMLVHTVIPRTERNGWNANAKINCIVGEVSWRDTPRTSYSSNYRDYVEAVNRYLNFYQSHHVILTHRNSIELTQEVLDPKPYEVQRIEPSP